MLFKDARNAQILALSVFLGLGFGARDWTLHPDRLLAIVLSCLLTQLVLSLAVNLARRPDELPTRSPNATLTSRLAEIFAIDSLRSALITALGLCLLLRSDRLSALILAGCLAIASKFLIRVRGKHVFNPSNFGIIIALTFTQDAWVSPGQWGDDRWFLMVFVVAAGLILRQVGRWDTSIVFLAGYVGLLGTRDFLLGWGGDVLLHQVANGSLLLFAFFMITDPRSIPDARWSRIIWALALAVLSFVLQVVFFMPTAPFWALFCLSPVTPLLDWLWQAPRFNWQVPTAIANKVSPSF